MTDIVERLRDNYCRCLPAYKDRGMIDPQCESCQTADERNEAADEIERLRLDAARYRKWRADYTGGQISDLLIALADTWTSEQVDAAIDAAMKA